MSSLAVCVFSFPASHDLVVSRELGFTLRWLDSTRGFVLIKGAGRIVISRVAGASLANICEGILSVQQEANARGDTLHGEGSGDDGLALKLEEPSPGRLVVEMKMGSEFVTLGQEDLVLLARHTSNISAVANGRLVLRYPGDSGKQGSVGIGEETCHFSLFFLHFRRRGQTEADEALCAAPTQISVDRRGEAKKEG